MNFINNILPEKIIYSLGWTMVHSIWQGALIALLLFAFITLIKSSSAVKAKVSVIALGLMVVSFLTTFSVELASFNNNKIVPENAVVLNNASQLETNSKTLNNPTDSSSPVVNVVNEIKNVLAENVSLLAMIWFAGFIIFTARFFGGFYITKKLKYSGTSFVPAEWQNRANSICYRLKILKPVRLLESVNVNVPIVIGYIKPVILMPVGMLTGMEGEQVEAIIAHELGHIYRNDFLINTLQSLGEIILFYHPAAWWISHKIREERENCCDDIAVSVCGDKLTFAKALANLEEVIMKNKQFALAIKNQKTLMGRIKRLFDTGHNKIRYSEKFLVSAVILAVLLTTTIFASVSVKPLNQRMQSDSSRLVADSVWAKGHYNYVNKDIKVSLYNGKIVELYLKGKKIPENKFDDYKKFVERTLDSLNLSPPSVPPPPKVANLPPKPLKAPKPVIDSTINTPKSPPPPKNASQNSNKNKNSKTKIGANSNSNINTNNSSNSNSSTNTNTQTTTTYTNTAETLPGSGLTGSIASSGSLTGSDSVAGNNVNITGNITRSSNNNTYAIAGGSLTDNTGTALAGDDNDSLRIVHEQKVSVRESRIKVRKPGDKLTEVSENKNDENSRGYTGQFIDLLTTELVNRGIISENEKFDLKLTHDELLINGEKQPDELLRIALTLYKKARGKELSDNANYQINR